MDRVNYTAVADLKDPLVAEVEYRHSLFQLIIYMDS